MIRPVALFALFLQLSQAALAAEPAPLVSAAELALNYSLPLVWTAPLPPTSLAYLNATASRSFLIDNWNLSSGTAASLSFVPNPVSAGVAGAEGLVLEVDYPVGTRVGAQFHMSPFEDFTSVQTAVLSYQLAFSEGFGFVKGGKLPGLYGGDLVDQCTGGERTLACFSARLMWRARGAGEVYVYTPTYDYFCNTRSVLCNLEYGISISRDSFTFVPNKWMTITQLISLNTPPLNNGVLALYVNGKLAMQHNNMAWRDNTSVALSRVLFSTFFGGGDATWNSRGGQTYYRGFEAYAGSAPSALAGMAVNITVEWEKLSVAAREETVLAVLDDVIYPDRRGRRSGLEYHRFLFREIPLEALTVSKGEGLFKLARHFLLDPKRFAQDFDAEKTTFRGLKNTGIENTAGFAMEQDFPAARADRAQLETFLLERHKLLSVFVGMILGVLELKRAKTTIDLRSLLHTSDELRDTCACCSVSLRDLQRQNSRAKLSRCSKCQAIGRIFPYCSRRCQCTAWSSHKSQCRAKLQATYDNPIL